MLRRQLITDKKLPDSFEFSQSYVFFYDKLERMNYNLKLVEDLKNNNHEWDSRVIQHILKEPFGDGGQWVMFTNIANKYGLIPKGCLSLKVFIVVIQPVLIWFYLECLEHLLKIFLVVQIIINVNLVLKKHTKFLLDFLENLQKNLFGIINQIIK